MSAKAHEMLQPRQLNDADEEILNVLAGERARMRPVHIADEADLGRSYCSQRLKRLVEHGHVSQPRSGLYEYVDDAREEADDDA